MDDLRGLVERPRVSQMRFPGMVGCSPDSDDAQALAVSHRPLIRKP